MRFHVVSLPHTHVTEDFSACAFTMKVLRFCNMMMDLGHEVYLYAGEKADCRYTEHIECIPEFMRASIPLADGHYTSASFDNTLKQWQYFNLTAAAEITQRIEPHDFICLIGGLAHKPIADLFPGHMSVEFGIGYGGTFAKYKVFESNAWMHMHYGFQAAVNRIGISAVDGNWMADCVIPNQVDPTQVLRAEDTYVGNDPYYLYVGRLTVRKGYKIAQQVCEYLGKRLLLVGPEAEPFTGYGEYLGVLGPAERNKLMAGAEALFAPTQYIEPFGTVTVEAMCNGCPVLSSDFGVFTETVLEGDGHRCRTLQEFADSAENLEIINHEWPGTRQERQDRALNRWSTDVVALQYQKYFERLSTIWEGNFDTLKPRVTTLEGAITIDAPTSNAPQINIDPEYDPETDPDQVEIRALEAMEAESAQDARQEEASGVATTPEASQNVEVGEVQAVIDIPDSIKEPLPEKG